MALTARLVLQDCQVALDRLENETDDRIWRLGWVTAVTLVRAVGHVLDKVDGRENPEVRKLSHELHKSWKVAPEHEIFREFIENERNNILKEYEFGVSDGPVELLVTIRDDAGVVSSQSVSIRENLYRPMHAGYYEGEDGRTLLEKAVEWWHAQLSIIEAQLKQ